MKKHAWEGSWIRKLRSLGRRKRELPRRGCVCCPQTPANPAQDLLTSHFEECFSIVWRSARELRKGRLNCLKMKPRAPQNDAKMYTGGLPKGPWRLLGGPWAPRGSLGALLVRSWLLLGASWGAPGGSWGRLGAVLGPLGPLLGPPEQLLGLILASRGALFGAFWASVFERPWKKTKTLIFADSSSLFKVF